jgi:filamentous hemagglutinin
VSEYQIVSKIAHPSTPSVWKIKYRIYARDKTGVLTGRLKAAIYDKTIYDPTVWTDDKLVQAAIEAAKDAISKGKFRREWTGITKDGIIIRGYQEKGQIQSFFFD